MKILIIMLSLCSIVLSGETVKFSEWFTDRSMRIDYYHVGDKTSEIITIDKIYQEAQWAGTQTKMIDPDENGKYRIKIYDKNSNILIFSRGFNSYFGEYQTTAKAAQGIKHTYHESAIIPFPKQDIVFTLESRKSGTALSQVYSTEIDPDDVNIIRHSAVKNVKIYNAHSSAHPRAKVDLAIIGEGYTLEDQGKFEKDLQHFTNVFFNHEPYKMYKERFNIYGLYKPSLEGGCDEPTHSKFKNTSVSSTFNSMGSPRYLLTEDNRALHDIASVVPYDALLIMVNHKRYGGGGIYNFYLTFTSDNDWRDYVFIHEFGHSFAGLADEYYSSATAYEEFYPRGVEPVEPNITALENPSEIKWKELLTKDITLPTPWEKTQYDSLNNAYQKKRQQLNREIARLKRNLAPHNEIKMAEQRASLNSRFFAGKMDSLMKHEVHWKDTGAFEGAGYMSKGLYRPMLDCIMFSKGVKKFCTVCEQAIIKKIKYYTE